MYGFKLTPDMIISIGLVLALIIGILFGSSSELLTGIVGGLTGYLGRTIVDSQDKHNVYSQHATQLQEKPMVM